MRDISFLTDAEIQSARYQGSSGTEGSDQVGGKLKPDAWGFCSKVQPIYLGLDANGRHQFGAGSGSIVGVLRVWDRASLLEPVSSNPQPGQYSVDVSTGTIVLGGGGRLSKRADAAQERGASFSIRYS